MRKKRKKYTQEEIDILLNNYESKGCKFCMGLMEGRREQDLWWKARQLGLRVEKDVISKIKEKNDFDKFAVHPSVFLNINTPEVAYMLGVMWADGNISRDTVIHNCARVDANFIYPIFLKTGNWRIKYRRRNPLLQEQSEIYTSNKFIYRFLKENNYTSKYDSANKILQKIPDNLKHYWFRGLIDGDGCISVDKRGRYKVSVSGPFEQNWDYLENLFIQMGIKYSIFRKKWTDRRKGANHKSSVIVTQNKNGFVKFLNYIYTNYEQDKIGLPRKYNSYIKGIQQIEIKENFSNRKNRVLMTDESNGTETQFKSCNECFRFLGVGPTKGYSIIKSNKSYKGYRFIILDNNTNKDNQLYSKIN